MPALPDPTQFGTPVARARPDGSPPFDATRPADRLVVDPDYPDAVVVDLQRLDAETVRSAVSVAPDPTAAFRLLATASATRSPSDLGSPLPAEAVRHMRPLGLPLPQIPVGMWPAASGGWETLRLPFLTGPQPVRPEHKVTFHLPQAGRHTVRYHAVVDTPTCVVLVLDTRYDGDVYQPPQLQQPIRIDWDDRRSVVGWLLGLHFELGALACTVIVKDDSETES